MAGILDQFPIQPGFDPRFLPGLLGQTMPQFSGPGLLAQQPAPAAAQTDDDAPDTPTASVPAAPVAPHNFFPQTGAPGSPDPSVAAPPQPSFIDRLTSLATNPQNDFFGKLTAIGAGIAGGRNIGEGFANGLSNYHQQRLQDAVAQQQQVAALQKQQQLAGAVALAKRANPNLSDGEALAYASNPALLQQAAARVTPTEQYRTDKDADGNLVQVNTLTGQKSILVSAKENKDPTSVQEFQFAQKNGYAGSFNDFLNAKASGGDSKTHVVGANQALTDNAGKVLFKNEGGGGLSDAAADYIAERRLAGDKSAMQNLGRGAQGSADLAKINGLIAQKATDRGLKASDFVDTDNTNIGRSAGARSAGTLNARIDIYANEAAGAISAAREASLAYPRTGLVPINKAVNAFKSNSGDPAYSQFVAANNAVVNTYAKALNPSGAATVSDKEHAREMISTAQTQEQYDAVLRQLDREIQIAHTSARSAHALGKQEVGTAPFDNTPDPRSKNTGLLGILGIGGSQPVPPQIVPAPPGPRNPGLRPDPLGIR